MGRYFNRKIFFYFLLTILISVSCYYIPLTGSTEPTTNHSIKLNEHRWRSFPLNVLVEMNQWSRPEYAEAVREAMDNWIKSIWNFTHSYRDTTLGINYIFYINNINATSRYDIIVSFTPNEMPPNSRTVGLTTYKWNLATHEPIPPIMINITTHSATAQSLFIKNVAMHELGHALGLGHASTQDTSNGPELMYYTSFNDKTIFPSTLDVYGLLMLYEGNFGQIVSLPLDIPYRMLAEGEIPALVQSSPLIVFYPTINRLGDTLSQPTVLLVPSVLWLFIALFFGLFLQSGIEGSVMAITVFILMTYYLTSWNIPLNLLGIKVIVMLPAIVIGASMGGAISRRFVKTVY